MQAQTEIIFQNFLDNLNKYHALNFSDLQSSLFEVTHEEARLLLVQCEENDGYWLVNLSDFKNAMTLHYMAKEKYHKIDLMLDGDSLFDFSGSKQKFKTLNDFFKGKIDNPKPYTRLTQLRIRAAQALVAAPHLLPILDAYKWADGFSITKKEIVVTEDRATLFLVLTKEGEPIDSLNIKLHLKDLERLAAYKAVCFKYPFRVEDNVNQFVVQHPIDFSSKLYSISQASILNFNLGAELWKQFLQYENFFFITEEEAKDLEKNIFKNYSEGGWYIRPDSQLDRIKVGFSVRDGFKTIDVSLKGGQFHYDSPFGEMVADSIPNILQQYIKKMYHYSPDNLYAFTEHFNITPHKAWESISYNTTVYEKSLKMGLTKLALNDISFDRKDIVTLISRSDSKQKCIPYAALQRIAKNRDYIEHGAKEVPGFEQNNQIPSSSFANPLGINRQAFDNVATKGVNVTSMSLLLESLDIYHDIKEEKTKDLLSKAFDITPEYFQMSYFIIRKSSDPNLVTINYLAKDKSLRVTRIPISEIKQEFQNQNLVDVDLYKFSREIVAFIINKGIATVFNTAFPITKYVREQLEQKKFDASDILRLPKNHAEIDRSPVVMGIIQNVAKNSNDTKEAFHAIPDKFKTQYYAVYSYFDQIVINFYIENKLKSLSLRILAVTQKVCQRLADRQATQPEMLMAFEGYIRTRIKAEFDALSLACPEFKPLTETMIGHLKANKMHLIDFTTGHVKAEGERIKVGGEYEVPYDESLYQDDETYEYSTVLNLGNNK